MSRYAARSARRPYLLAAAVAAVALTVTPAGALATTPHATTTHATTTPMSPDAAAVATAKATHRPVTVGSQTTPTSMTVANPNGTLTMTTNLLPVRVKAEQAKAGQARGAGVWRPVSATLHRDPDGSLSPAATPSGVTLSGGGDGPLATLTSPDGSRVAIAFPARLPRPDVSGDTASYLSVLPGVDLDVSVDTLGGISATLVIHDAAAAANPAVRTLRLGLAAAGLHVATDAAGNLTVTGRRGRAEFSAPPATMWNSAATMSSAAGPAPDAPAATVPFRDDHGGLTLTPDRALMTAKTAYPAYVQAGVNPDTTCDQTQENVAENCQQGFVETQEGSPCNTYLNWDKEQGATHYNGNGAGLQNYSQPCEGTYISYYVFDTGMLHPSMHVISATLTAWDNYGASWSCKSSFDFWVNWTGLAKTTTDWNNKPGNDPHNQSRETSAEPGPNPHSGCTDHQPTWNLTYAMAAAAAANSPTMTFDITGENNGDGFMRFGDNPDIVTIFDENPKTPTALDTSPESHAIPYGDYDACGTSSTSPGWIGATDLGAGGASAMSLSTSIAPNVSGEPVRAEYSVWDQTNGHQAITQNPSNYYAPGGTTASTTNTPISFTLQDGHVYEWTATAEVNGFPNAPDGPYTTPATEDCYFAVDLSSPATPTVTSPDYPPSGQLPDVRYAGQSGTFSFSSSDPEPAGCTAGSCLASGVYGFEYQLNSPLPAPSAALTAGCPTATTPGFVLASNPNSTGAPSTAASCPIPTPQWGTSTLYVAAIDKAGNISQTEQYDFYVPWKSTKHIDPGNITGNGVPDLLGTAAGTGPDAGALVLYPGNQDPQAGPVIAGPEGSGPGGSAWSEFQITHRGSMSSRTIDDLFALKGGQLYVYANGGGGSDEFDNTGNVADISGNWSDVTQVLAPGDAWLPASKQSSLRSLPSLFAVTADSADGGDLYLYPGEPGDSLGTPIEVGQGGWSGMTLIAPGVVNGSLALWARDNSTGALYSYPISIVNRQPTLNSGGGPIGATSSTPMGGVRLPQGTYPAVASPGALDNSSDPGLYAEDTSGTTPGGGSGSCANGCLWYYPGQSATGGATPLASTPIFVGVLSQPVTQLS